MTLKIHNTMAREKQEFVPLDDQNVRMYVCGPTVYDNIHIGNARPLVVFDVLYRLLKRLYPKVTYARNITDVDDKIIAASEETGEPIDSVTAKPRIGPEPSQNRMNAAIKVVILASRMVAKARE